MRVMLDTNALIHLIDKRAAADIRDRLIGLLDEVHSGKGEVIICAQVVAEYLSHAGAAGAPILEAFLRARAIRVTPFDHMAAVECALMQASASATGNKRSPLAPDAIWQKVKVDRQIVAIAKARGARIISDDKDIHGLSASVGVPVQRCAELPLPAWARQLHIPEVPMAPVKTPPRRLVLMRADGRLQNPGDPSVPEPA